MPLVDDLWKRLRSSLVCAAILGVLLCGASWGSFGVGAIAASAGLVIIVLAITMCACTQEKCLGKQEVCCPGGSQCLGLPDCAYIKMMFHMRNFMMVVGPFVLFASVPTLLIGIVNTISPDGDGCYVRCEKVLRGSQCATCWNLAWTAHPHRRWEWGLNEICWESAWNAHVQAARANAAPPSAPSPAPGVSKTGKTNSLEFTCAWERAREHAQDKEYHVNGPMSDKECRDLCDCMGGTPLSECTSQARMFGIAGIVSGLLGFYFVCAIGFACHSATGLLQESGGPAIALSDAQWPQSHQTVGQVVGQPVILAAQADSPAGKTS